MVIIEYHPKLGKAISDGLVGETFNQVKWAIEKCRHEHLMFSTENIFNKIRLAVVKKEIDPEKFRFRYNSQEIVVNQYGAIQQWPEGFCSTNIRLSEKILRTAFAVKKSK